MAREVYRESAGGLVVEVQFAASQFQSGMYHLCRVPLDLDGDIFQEMREDAFKFALHDGLLGITTGLERLAKVVLTMQGFRDTGEFPNLRRFGHRLGSMFQEIEDSQIRFGQSVGGQSIRAASDVSTEGLEPFDSKLIKLLDNFAGGGGRYEYLDALSGGSGGGGRITQSMHSAWKELADSEAGVPEWLAGRVTLFEDMGNWVYFVSNQVPEMQIEAVLTSYIDNHLDRSINESSTLVSLKCLHYAQWLSRLIGQIQSDIAKMRPGSGWWMDLREISGRGLLNSDDLFIDAHVLKLEDVDFIRESMEETPGWLERGVED